MVETQANNPEDPGANLEIGRFLCFVKGSWDLGLRFLLRGSDSTLKTLAEKEIAFPVQGQERVAIADGWYDLADKEKSPLRKVQMQAHSKTLYEATLTDASDLLRAKIEKRLGELGKLEYSPAVVPPQGLVGQWLFDEGKGTIASDSSGKGNQGTIFGGARWVSGGDG